MKTVSERLRERAHELALTHQLRTYSHNARRVWREIANDAEELDDAIGQLGDTSPACASPVEQWLIDHAAFLHEHTMILAEEAQSSALRKLPMLRKPYIPRLLELSEAYLELMDGEVEEHSWRLYLNAYQEISVLTIAEGWAMQAVLRTAVFQMIHQLLTDIQDRRSVCGQVEQIMAQLEQAEPSAEQMNEALDKIGVSVPMSGPLIVHLIQHLREWSGDSATVRNWLQCKLENEAENLDQIVTYDHQLQTARQLTMGKLINSLRAITRWNWRSVFEHTSLVEKSLQAEHSGLYRLMDDASRDFIRASIERLAARMKVPENLVAECAIQLSEQSSEDRVEHDNTLREAYLAYYVLEEQGVQQLRQALLDRCKPRAMPEQKLWKRTAGSYYGLLTLCTALMLVLGAMWVDPAGYVSVWGWLAIVLCLLAPAVEWGIMLAHWVIQYGRRTQPLLKYDFSQGIPQEAATMIVIPVIWSTADEVYAMSDRLEQHYLANRGPYLSYALLGDYGDSDQQREPEDAQLLDTAISEINRLNETYPGDVFHLFHRGRSYNEREGKWMGWERKRGKLVELVELLKGRPESTYETIVGDQSQWTHIRYLITLDADTELPVTSAQRMIGTIHFPYNRPRLNEARTRVVEGYGILQPRIGISLASAEQSKLASLLSRPSGYDPYVFAASDPYQDSVGHGVFVGKGIIDVDAFSELLCERIPDNSILSHDLLEGGILRAGLLSDVELIDGHPGTYLSYQKRQHRWIRGDWQLLRFMGRQVPDRMGQRQPVALPSITRFQMVDNLRRSLLHAILFLLLWIGVALLPGEYWRWSLLVVATLFLPLLRYSIASWRSIPVLFGQCCISIMTLPYNTVVQLDAIIRSLYRLLISKRGMLEWASMGEVEMASKEGRRPPMLGLAGGYLLIVLFLVTCMLFGDGYAAWIGSGLSVLWAAAPLVIRQLDKPLRPESHTVWDEQTSAWLESLAREIWRFYADYVTEEDSYLPPDNVQISPPNGVAHRTSPTNIGLYMTAVVTARDFGFIDSDECLLRIDQTLRTVERLEKWEGHLFNWYDTRSLTPLTPRYISTVDSGNFVVCLITVMEGVRQYARDEAGVLTELGRRLIERLDTCIHQTNFRVLYVDHYKLFSLGYYPDTRHRDEILYDLIASEARQTSFIAVALQQVSVAHWHALGRSLAKVNGRPAFLSWSGTMFEYLMPGLFMRAYRNTIWESTYKAVVARQLAYAEEREAPMGISESGYYAFDFQMNYQYRAFGVPGLGFQPGLELDLVAAPYATIMALPYAGEESLKALRRMEELGARGQYGFYEAIDFTRQRMPEGQTYRVVQSFMAHHQGMAMLTIANLLKQGSVVHRFHQNKEVRSVEWLLQERIPEHPKYIRERAMIREHPRRTDEVDDYGVRDYKEPIQPSPAFCLLSNELCATKISTTGSGYMSYEDVHVNRWRQDPVSDPWGIGVYIRNVSHDRLWSAAYLPTRAVPEEQSIRFTLDKAVFSRVDGAVRTEMEVSIPPEAPAEIRRIRLTNLSESVIVLEVTSFLELALSESAADEAHPAFSKLFIRTAYVPDTDCLVAGRRAREYKGREVWAAHSLLVEGEHAGTAASATAYATDRASFIGRGHSMMSPLGLHGELHSTVGSVADPVFVMRKVIRIEPGETARLIMVTTVSRKEEEALDWVRRLRIGQSAELLEQLAWNRSRTLLRQLRITAAEAVMYQEAASQLLLEPAMSPERRQDIARNVKGQSALWPLGLSGDRPIMLSVVSDRVQLPFVHRLVICHEYLRRQGLAFDLVLLNDSDGGYRQELRDMLLRAAEHGVDRYGAGMSGVHIMGIEQLTTEELTLLRSLARISLYAGGASLQAQLRKGREPQRKRDASSIRSVPATTKAQLDRRSISRLVDLDSANQGEDELLYYNGWGGFTSDGSEYRMTIRRDHYLPAPWINVMANDKFGCIISELGTGYTWWRNSRECKLTPWSNDPVLDPPGELCYIKDEQTGAYWLPTPYAGPQDASYQVTHGLGYSRITHVNNGIQSNMTCCVPVHDAIKLIKLELKNRTSESRELSVTTYAEWVIGVKRHENAPFIETEWSDDEQTLLARNLYQEYFREANAFLRIYAPNSDCRWSWTADRRTFIGIGGVIEQPEALRAKRLSGKVGLMSDSCGAIQAKFSLAPHEEKTVYLMLGCEDSQEQALALSRKYASPKAFDDAWQELHEFWDGTLKQVQVETPSKEMDILLNGWLLYQTLACRMWARTAFYQAGGATGFRDQLQDALALLHTRPDLSREQILLHASHQYEEGDVQHWWHEETEKGIRTKFSDDLLWLPYAASRYLEHTEATDILDEQVRYLTSEQLSEEEHERYEPTVIAQQTGTLYEHCCRAIDKALSRIGEHGLPLIGVGDWNDGMNLVGAEGRGESVWLGWFLSDVLRRFELICSEYGESDRASRYRQAREELAIALDQHGWDDAWYRRAFTDDGRWLGSLQSEECKIDAIAQSWSVISGAGDPDKSRLAMQSFDRELVDRKIAVARLLSPPFDRTDPSPGYIQGYPPGIRENGAQYTHGVIWGIVAWSLLDEGDKAAELFQLLNPINHTRTSLEVQTYCGEPYAMAADVYTREPHVGRAGWTWYTGAAGWFYQAGLESILGIRRRGNWLCVRPCIPRGWKQYKVRYQYRSSSYRIAVDNAAGQSVGIREIHVDGELLPIEDVDSQVGRIALIDDGRDHEVKIIM